MRRAGHLGELASTAGKIAIPCVVAAIAFTGAAKGADLADLIKNGPPEIPPLTYKGVTIYGVIDVAAQYESRGVPLNGLIYSSFGIIGPPNRSTPRWVIAPNQESQSFVGIKMEEDIGYGFTFLGRAEVGFNPTSGELSDAVGAMRLNNGIPLAQQTANADGPRAGQVFNGELWAGVSNSAYGTLKVGRVNALSLDMIGSYDPLASYGFSLVGFFGSLAGAGSSEDARVDESVKYSYSYGPFRVAGLYGAPDSNVKTIWQANAGFDYKGFSFDVMGGHVSDGITVTALSGAAFLGSPFVGGKVYDTDMYGFFAKYKLDLGTGGSSDENAFRSSITFSGGYSRIDYSNPADGGYAPGHSTIGGYQIGPQFSTTGSSLGGVVNYAFTGGNRLLDVSFAGVKYQYDPRWTVSAAYYRFDQNSFGFGVPNLSFYNGSGYSRTKCSSSNFTNCSGAEQVASVRVDYQWTKNLNLYAGITFSRVDGGLAFGYLEKEMYAPTVGAKLAF